MTTLNVGDVFHLRAPMTVALTEHESRAFQRGTTIVVTEELLEMSRDRNGNSWLDLVDDPQAQAAKYGAVKFAPGPCPDDVNWFDGEVGDGAWNLAREMELERVAAISDPVERAAAQKVVVEKFGRKATSQTLATYAPDAVNTYSPQDVR